MQDPGLVIRRGSLMGNRPRRGWRRLSMQTENHPVRRVPRAGRLKRRKGSGGPKEVVILTKEEKMEARDKGMDFKRTLTVMSTRGSRFMAPSGITREKGKEGRRVMGTLSTGEYKICLFTP